MGKKLGGRDLRQPCVRCSCGGEGSRVCLKKQRRAREGKGECLMYYPRRRGGGAPERTKKDVLQESGAAQ